MVGVCLVCSGTPGKNVAVTFPSSPNNGVFCLMLVSKRSAMQIGFVTNIAQLWWWHLTMLQGQSRPSHILVAWKWLHTVDEIWKGHKDPGRSNLPYLNFNKSTRLDEDRSRSPFEGTCCLSWTGSLGLLPHACDHCPVWLYKSSMWANSRPRNWKYRPNYET